MNLVSNLKRLLTEKENNPAWKLTLQKDIETKRKELSIIAELEKGHGHVKERKVRNNERKYNIWRNQSLTEVKEIIKQQRLKEFADLIRDANFTAETKPLKKTLRDSTVNLEKSQSRSTKHQKCRKSKIFGVKYGRISKPIIATPHGLRIKKKNE